MFKITISFLPESDLMEETYLFSILDSVDSTNNYAMGEVHAGLARHGQAWFANEQTGGKGQRGKKWETGRNENIALSIAVVPRGLSPRQQFRLSVAVALGCYDFFYEKAGEGTAIKWPNDIYWSDRKAGGILIENILRGNEWQYSVIGIGINLNREIFADELKQAISLKMITGTDYEIVAEAKELHKMIMKRVQALNEDSFPEMHSQYNARLYKKGSTVLLKSGAEIKQSVITGVSANGKLLTREGREYEFGEVDWVPGGVE